jgi:glycosyltransferase involved in cell wall biosynthesis
MLIESLSSVLSGDFTDFEVLVANDGDEDDIAAVREQFTDPRIERPENLGMLANNVDAFARARGEFIAHLDDDDFWAPGLLSTLVPALEANDDIVVAFCDHYVVDADGVVDEALTEANSSLWGRATLAGGAHRDIRKLAAVNQSIAVQCAAVFRKRALDLNGYPDAVGVAWDTWTSYLLGQGGGSAWYVPQRLAYYRAHGGGQTARGLLANAQAGVYIFDQFLNDPALEPWAAVFKARLAGSHHRLATELIRGGHGHEARRHALRALALRPSARAAAFALAACVAPRGSRRLLLRRRGAVDAQ